MQNPQRVVVQGRTVPVRDETTPSDSRAIGAADIGCSQHGEVYSAARRRYKTGTVAWGICAESAPGDDPYEADMGPIDCRGYPTCTLLLEADTDTTIQITAAIEPFDLFVETDTRLALKKGEPRLLELRNLPLVSAYAAIPAKIVTKFYLLG